jgi:hypothetical protein
MNKLRFKLNYAHMHFVRFGVFLIFMSCKASANGMTISGPIFASTVTVAGSVTVSSMTVSSLTVSNLLQISGTRLIRPGSPIQMQFSSSTLNTVTSSSTFQAVTGMNVSIALSNAANYIRISLTGTLATDAAITSNAYLTIMRDSTDLGNTSDNSGLAIATDGMISGGSLFVPAGITITDSPGDTNTHTYQVYIRAVGAQPAGFTTRSVGYLLLEEIQR